MAGAFENVPMITTTLPADRWNGSAKHTKAQHPKDILEIEFKGLGFMCQGGPTGRISKTQALLATNKVSIPMRPK